MKASIGAIVHYVSHGSPVRPDGSQRFKAECRAAIITELATPDGLTVGLPVMNPTGYFFQRSDYEAWDSTTAFPGAVAHGGSWHWPEPVE